MTTTIDPHLQPIPEQLARMYDAAASQREDLAESQPNRYRVMVEGPMDEIRRLHRQLDEYAGLSLKESEADLWIRIEGEDDLLGPRAPLRLTRDAHERIDSSLDKLAVEKVETHRGYLREIDLDEQAFQLRKPGDPTSVRCAFGDELLPLAKEALDRLVEVTGTRKVHEGRKQSALELPRLEIVDEEADAEGET